MNIYTESGYEGRMHYLECLAEDYGVDLQSVITLASLLGSEEDFDGLVSSVEELEADLEYCL